MVNSQSHVVDSNQRTKINVGNYASHDIKNKFTIAAQKHESEKQGEIKLTTDQLFA